MTLGHWNSWNDLSWSDIGEMWHADAEWHDNYDDDVETEKHDGLKTKIAHHSVAR